MTFLEWWATQDASKPRWTGTVFGLAKRAFEAGCASATTPAEVVGETIHEKGAARPNHTSPGSCGVQDHGDGPDGHVPNRGSHVGAPPPSSVDGEKAIRLGEREKVFNEICVALGFAAGCRPAAFKVREWKGISDKFPENASAHPPDPVAAAPLPSEGEPRGEQPVTCQRCGGSGKRKLTLGQPQIYGPAPDCFGCAGTGHENWMKLLAAKVVRAASPSIAKAKP